MGVTALATLIASDEQELGKALKQSTLLQQEFQNQF